MIDQKSTIDVIKAIKEMEQVQVKYLLRAQNVAGAVQSLFEMDLMNDLIDTELRSYIKTSRFIVGMIRQHVDMTEEMLGGYENQLKMEMPEDRRG